MQLKVLLKINIAMIKTLILGNLQLVTGSNSIQQIHQ